MKSDIRAGVSSQRPLHVRLQEEAAQKTETTTDINMVVDTMHTGACALLEIQKELCVSPSSVLLRSSWRQMAQNCCYLAFVRIKRERERERGLLSHHGGFEVCLVPIRVPREAGPEILKGQLSVCTGF